MNTGSLKTFYWLMKREFWEHRGGFLWAPVITAGVFLLLGLMGITTAEVISGGNGFAVGGTSGLQYIISGMDAGDLGKVGMALDVAMYSAMGLITIVTGFVVLFYCLGALYDDRRDRSILFWKSLPVSDRDTVLSKVACATVLAPAIAIVMGVLCGIVHLLILALVLSFHGVSVWHLLMLAHPLRVTANLIGALPLHLLFALPAVGWLLLCSAWARSKPFLWAVLMPVLAGVLMGWFHIMGVVALPAGWFWSHVVLRMLVSVFPGAALVFASRAGTVGDGNELAFMNLRHTYAALGSPELWIGVVIGVALIAAAIWFRRWRDDR